MNPHLVRGFAPNPCDGRVGETIALGNPQRLRILGTGSQSLLDVKDVGDLVEEEHVNSGLFVQLLHRASASDRLSQAKQTVVASMQQPLFKDIVR